MPKRRKAWFPKTVEDIEGPRGYPNFPADVRKRLAGMLRGMSKKDAKKMARYLSAGEIDPKNLTFEVIEDDPKDRGPRDKGYIIHKIIVYVDGKEAGYLKISHVQPELVKELFPTIWDWARAHRGWPLHPETDTLPELWSTAHHYAHRIPTSDPPRTTSWMVSPEDAAGLSDAVLKADLKDLQKTSGLTRDYKKWAKETFDIPFVDYILVKDEFQRQGIGTELYIAGAKWLAERFGLPLRSSTLQSTQAKNIWKKMAANPELPITAGKAWGKPAYFLDYTDAAA